MNKQEAIEKINDLWSFALEDGPFEVDLIIKNQVLDIVSQIDEPQKPVVPKFVAEWIEEAKEGECSLCTAFGLVDGDSKNFDWLFNGDKSNQDTFARAWLDGYTVEKEPLYTVEIPNPNEGQLSYVLMRKPGGNISINVVHSSNLDLLKNDKDLQLTESEIRKDFDWAWREGFMKEVTDL